MSSTASHALTHARVRADRQVALIAEYGRPADGNRASPAVRCSWGASIVAGHGRARAGNLGSSHGRASGRCSEGDLIG